MSESKFRALCAELLEVVEGEYEGSGCCVDLITRAHTALATPPPKPPTDEQLEKLADRFMVMDGATGSMSLEHLHFARAALEEFGQ